MQDIVIGNRAVGPAQPPYIIAEIGFNHGGNLALAESMIAAAATAGADAVKFQTFRADRLALASAPHFALVKSGELDEAAHHRLARTAAHHGVAFLSTPFCIDTADILKRTDVPAFKIASMDAANLPFLRHVAAFGRPILLSTGMSTLAEIGQAVEAIQAVGNDRIVLLHCMSLYPTLPEQAHLRTIQQLAEAFGLPVGYSDHVLGSAAAVGAVALGACVIEKHFTSDKSLPGPDHTLSADPGELAALVCDARVLHQALGRRCAETTRPDHANGAAFRRSIHAMADIPQGTVITTDMLACVRPGHGLGPEFLDVVVGRRATRDIPCEELVTLDMV